ncbi:MAG: efflux RND transporter periplasmic adaptor subunit [Mariniblastus sp.]
MTQNLIPPSPEDHNHRLVGAPDQVTQAHVKSNRIPNKESGRFEKAKPVDSIDPSRDPVRGGDVDSELVDQTKNQIRVLVQEIANLAKSDCTVEDFYEGFLTRTTSALASAGGAIWVRESVEAPFKLRYHINLKKTVLANNKKAQARHGRLLQKLADAGEPALVSPDSGSTDDGQGGNPTEFLLIAGPLKIDNETIGLVEIFQRPGAGPTTQRGYLRFLMQMCDIASDFLRNQQIRSFSMQQSMWQQLEQFMRLVHQGLDTDRTVFTLANEGRRLIDCDRVSVAMGTGRNCRIRAVSGLDSVERRAEQVKKLGSLAASVIHAGQPLWYSGEDNDLPPQIEKKLHAYVDKSHSKMLAIVPLLESEPDSEDAEKNSRAKKRKPLGALIIEQLTDSRVTPVLEKRAQMVAEHGQMALTNAAEHNSIFLMPVWKMLGKITAAFQGEKLLKTVGILGAIGLVCAFLAIYPYSFGLGAKGSLVPELRHEVFALTDGTTYEINVSDDGDTLVEAKQVLVRMSNSDIDLELSRIRGQVAQKQQEWDTNNRLMGNTRRSENQMMEKMELRSKMLEAEAVLSSLKEEEKIYLDQQALLDIRSPISGRVVNRNVRQNLMNRAIQRGQKLMTIVAPDTKWQLELEMPEKRISHLLKAQRESDAPLKVTFGLVSNPGIEYVGELVAVDTKLDVYSDEGNAALLTVAFPNEDIDLDLLLQETRVMAKVHCGTRSIGYVMFHELIETVQSSVMFWF